MLLPPHQVPMWRSGCARLLHSSSDYSPGVCHIIHIHSASPAEHCVWSHPCNRVLNKLLHHWGEPPDVSGSGRLKLAGYWTSSTCAHCLKLAKSVAFLLKFIPTETVKFIMALAEIRMKSFFLSIVSYGKHKSGTFRPVDLRILPTSTKWCTPFLASNIRYLSCTRLYRPALHCIWGHTFHVHGKA